MAGDSDDQEGSSRRVAPNWTLIKWMARQALAHPRRCVGVFLLQLTLLLLALSGLSLTGLGLDYLRFSVEGARAPQPRWPGGWTPPVSWSPFTVVLAIAGAVLALAAMRCLLRFANAMAQTRLVQVVLTELRTVVYDKLQRLSFRFFDAHQSGTLINRATTDVSAVATFSEYAVIQFFMLLLTLVVYFAYMLSINAWLTWVSLGATPLLLIASVVYARKVRPAYEKNRRLFDQMVLRLSENVQGQHVVKGFALERHETERFRKANDALRIQQRWLFRRTALYNVLVHVLLQVNLVIVLLGGGYVIVTHHGDPHPPLTVGQLIVFASLLNTFSQQVAALANIANTLQSSLTCAGRVYEVLHTPIEIASPPQSQAVRLPKPRGHVVFEDVSFAYTPGKEVLHGVSFEVQPGQCVAILGATGSGKSTLLSLLPRFYDPTAGRVLLDGVDLRRLALDDLRRSVGIVFQENFLFSNTVSSNIAFGHPDAPPEVIRKAAQVAAAHEFIEQLPLRYDTVIGEHGATLSGGQRQRLAIARAVLLEPALLILDDALSAVDPETEGEILAAMDNAMKGRTTFVVAHRLSTLRRADLVLVMDHGRIVQRGTHEQLMAADGHYARVAQMQVADRESRRIIQAVSFSAGLADTPLLEEELLP